jgi:two-component system, NarL family, response regulator NreC
MKIKVILADDHSIVRDGIKAVVDKKGDNIQIIGEAANGNEVLSIAAVKPADVYVLDISMPELNGLETASRLLAQNPQAKVIMLSMHDDRTFVERALRCGAKGYILKETATEEIVTGIREVHMGRYYLTPKISSYLVEDFLGKEQEKEAASVLSSRERGILQLLAEGSTSKEIADRLALSLHTVHVHKNNIMKKLNIHRQAELVKFALKEGIIQI